MRNTQDRALHYRRTNYKPGLGLCRCAVCKAAGERWREKNEPEAQSRLARLNLDASIPSESPHAWVASIECGEI